MILYPSPLPVVSSTYHNTNNFITLLLRYLINLYTQLAIMTLLPFFFFLNDPATPEISPLPLPDALPIGGPPGGVPPRRASAVPAWTVARIGHCDRSCPPRREPARQRGPTGRAVGPGAPASRHRGNGCVRRDGHRAGHPDAAGAGRVDRRPACGPRAPGRAANDHRAVARGSPRRLCPGRRRTDRHAPAL